MTVFNERCAGFDSSENSFESNWSTWRDVIVRLDMAYRSGSLFAVRMLSIRRATCSKRSTLAHSWSWSDDGSTYGERTCWVLPWISYSSESRSHNVPKGSASKIYAWMFVNNIVTAIERSLKSLKNSFVWNRVGKAKKSYIPKNSVPSLTMTVKMGDELFLNVRKKAMSVITKSTTVDHGELNIFWKTTNAYTPQLRKEQRVDRRDDHHWSNSIH